MLPREHQNFNVGLKAFVEKNGELLTLQDSEGLWELPGGRIEKSETGKNLREILHREVAEELGPNFQYEVGNVFHAWIRQPTPDKNFFILLIGFRCKYTGGDISLGQEHKNFRWINKETIVELEFENTYREAFEYYFTYPH